MPQTPQSIIDDRRSSQRAFALACKQVDIWKASQTQKSPPWGAATGFMYPNAQNPKFFVKFTDSRSKWLLEQEKRNQEFAFNTLHGLGPQQPVPQGLKLLVCVPEMFRAFEYEDYYFLIMECVPGRTLNQVIAAAQARAGDAKLGAGAGAGAGAGGQGDTSRFYRYIAEGICLLSVKAPPEAKPGPVGGGIIRHPLFSDFQATISYRNVEMIEKHLNKVLSFQTNKIITLEKELEFYYSNLAGDNFIFTSAGGHNVLYIVDFDEAGFLPPSFKAFVLHSTVRPSSIPVAQNIVQRIEHNKDNLNAMQTVSYFLLISVSRIGEFYPVRVSALLGIPARAQLALRCSIYLYPR
ncbi:hypothetical protein VM1G_06411 [Cytospora mali]|uniref:Aminoglycoside phosphotransferase domain-containing protein n=1 Tax=Cytospora mali TaxID=578113 RepID=A0A194W4B4_CYTMA|nr:hypothetical protein VM1G_06411 [Valsa mali]